MGFNWLIVGVLAVWRVTHLLQAEDGPWHLVVRLRRAAGSGLWGRLLDCFYCLSVWIAAPTAWLLGHSWKERIFLWPAFSGGAILLEKLTWREPAPPALYYEDKETNHVVLRKSKEPVTSDQTTLPTV